MFSQIKLIFYYHNSIIYPEETSPVLIVYKWLIIKYRIVWLIQLFYIWHQNIKYALNLIKNTVWIN